MQGRLRAEAIVQTRKIPPTQHPHQWNGMLQTTAMSSKRVDPLVENPISSKLLKFKRVEKFPDKTEIRRTCCNALHRTEWLAYESVECSL